MDEKSLTQVDSLSLKGGFTGSRPDESMCLSGQNAGVLFLFDLESLQIRQKYEKSCKPSPVIGMTFHWPVRDWSLITGRGGGSYKTGRELAQWKSTHPLIQRSLVRFRARSHTGVMDYDEACFMHITPGVVHNFPKAVGV